MNAVNNPEVEWQLRRIPLNSIRVDPAIQQRAAGTSRDVVDEYAEAMRNGAAFPPIDVFDNDDGDASILPMAFTAWRPTDWRIPTPMISNVRFTPATVTMRSFLPAARTRSTDCRAAARTS